VGQVENKYTKEILWVIFDVFFDTLKRGGDNPFLKKVLSSLLKIMTVKYSTGTTKKRRYILYMCVSVLCEPVPTHIDIMGDKKVIENVVEKIDILYKEIKKNEVSPNTDYLFHNLDRENEYKRTLMKMDMVNSADIIGGFI
jgi:predicted RNA-binding protein